MKNTYIYINKCNEYGTGARILQHRNGNCTLADHDYNGNGTVLFRDV